MIGRVPHTRYLPGFCGIRGSRMRRLRQREVPPSGGRHVVGPTDRIRRRPVLGDKEPLMSVRHLLAAAAAALPGGFGLATPATTRVSAQSAPVDAYTLTTGRLLGTVASLVGLAGMVIGGLVVAAAEGGPGTGYGIVGGFAALAIGLTATVLGWLALARSRRTV